MKYTPDDRYPDKSHYQEVIRFFGQFSFWQIDGKKDSDDADDVSGVTDEPVEPVEDGTFGCARVTPHQRHEGLDEAKTGCDATQDLRREKLINF